MRWWLIWWFNRDGWDGGLTNGWDYDWDRGWDGGLTDDWDDDWDGGWDGGWLFILTLQDDS